MRRPSIPCPDGIASLPRPAVPRQGPRNCLGQHLALLEARVVLGLLHERFTFRIARPATAGNPSPTIIPVGPTEPMDVFVE